jgi:hypothetical protein
MNEPFECLGDFFLHKNVENFTEKILMRLNFVYENLKLILIFRQNIVDYLNLM